MTEFSAWVGRSDERGEVIAATPVRLLAATLDLPPMDPVAGDPIPPMWHWLYFLPDASRSNLGPDGHPRRGDFYPNVPLRRRMFGEASATLHRPLRVGETATRRREVVSIDEKEGLSGPLVLVRVRHQIEGEDGPAVTEVQTIVYTDTPPGQPDGEGSATPEAPWQKKVETDPALVFRFSALTFNAHRIHYDLQYTTRVEGYPRLVVQGPLTALLLAEMARCHGVVTRAFRFRTRAPVFVGDVLHLRGTPTSEGARLEAYRDGVLAVEATVE